MFVDIQRKDNVSPLTPSFLYYLYIVDEIKNTLITSISHDAYRENTSNIHTD